MVTAPINATGWTELFNGHMIAAAYTVYDSAMPGWFIPMLFVVYQFLLYFKTRNPTLMWVTGFFFVSMYATAVWIGPYINVLSVQIMFLILVFEIAGILYLWVMK